jgi:hypothetical protein
MLMREMFRRFPAVIALALLLAVAPLLHNHPLSNSDGTTGAPCAVCAAGTHVLPVAEPVGSASIQVVETLVARNDLPAPIAAPLPRASRAPPAV